MPLYEYECLKCGRHTERIEKLSGPHIKKCPHCGGKLERVLAAPAIQFKGSGWYVTDYARKAGATDAPPKEAASDSAKDGASAPEAKTKEAPAKDTKEKKAARKK